jgi:1,4-alpha-glucan branching enzyme
MIQIMDSRKGKRRHVVFSLPDAEHLRSASVVGEFNDWDATRHPMRQEGDGVWQATVQLAPGEYEFRYLVNGGEWLNEEQAELRPNPYGSENGVLRL